MGCAAPGKPAKIVPAATGFRSNPKREQETSKRPHAGKDVAGRDDMTAVLCAAQPSTQADMYSKYVLGPCIGRGTFATVYQAWHKESGLVYAFKVNATKETEKTPRTKAWKSEIAIMRLVKGNPYCVSIHDSSLEESQCVIVMDLCPGSVVQLLEDDEFLLTVTEDSIAHMCRDVMRGLAHLHEKAVVHRDMKLDNLLYTPILKDRKTGSNHRVRLADFGLAAIVPKGAMLWGTVGTAPFMCPEMLLNDQYRDKADTWSVGVMMYVLMYGRFPYKPRKKGSKKMKQAIREGGVISYQPSVEDVRPSECAVNFTAQLLQRNPDMRMDAKSALCDDFLAFEINSACEASSRRQRGCHRFTTVIQAAGKLGAWRQLSEPPTTSSTLSPSLSLRTNSPASPGTNSPASPDMLFTKVIHECYFVDHAPAPCDENVFGAEAEIGSLHVAGRFP